MWLVKQASNTMKRIQLRCTCPPSPEHQTQYALVDDEDYDWLSNINWSASPDGYARGRARKGFIDPRTGEDLSGLNFSMHRLIMRPPANLVVDHIHHNTFDNRKSQLRVVTQKKNRANSRPKGFRQWL